MTPGAHSPPSEAGDDGERREAAHCRQTGGDENPSTGSRATIRPPTDPLIFQQQLHACIPFKLPAMKNVCIPLYPKDEASRRSGCGENPDQRWMGI
jgi:hypothetical protein